MVGLRCSVRSLADFQASSRPAKVIRFGTEPEVLISNGTSQVFICNRLERGVTAVHQFAGRVTHVVPSTDGRGVYALCESDGVYFAPLPHSSRNLSPAGVSAGDCSIQTRLEVSTECCVVRDHGVQTFTVVGTVLVTVALGDGVWRFGLYEVPDLPLPSYQKLAELRVPGLSKAGPSAAAGASSQGALPVLCCVHAQGGTSRSLEGGGHFLLEPLLFRLLFGVDASLVSSPMILCGLPDGRLCYLPLLLPGRLEVRGQASRVRVLHSLEQPIAFIGTSVRPQGGDGPSSLMAVGRGGVVLQLRVEEGPEGRVVGFEEWRVCGPVECACLSDTHLYYSTCSDLLALSLDGGTGSDPPSPAIQMPLSLNVCRVLALAAPTLDPTGAVQLLAVSLTGRLLLVTLPQGSDRGHVSRVSAAHMGQRVRDLLASIGTVSDRASFLKSSLRSRSTTLKSLNHVFNICCLLRPNQDAGDIVTARERPIRCGVAVRWTNLLQRDSLTLSCVLENTSSFLLESGWTLCVLLVNPPYVTPIQAPPTQSYAFPLQPLFPGSSLTVALPLAGAGDISFPVSIQCSLVYSLQSLLGQQEAGPLLGAGLLSLPLDSLIVDWLDCLCAQAPFPGSVSASAWDPVRTFLKSRGAGPQLGVAETGPFMACIRVSSELLWGVLGTPGLDIPSLCSALLNWLLPTGPGFESGGGTAVCVRGPGGAVTLTAEEVTVGQVCAVGPVSVVELRVESASLRAACGLHHAALRRLQALLNNVAMTTKPSLQLEGQSLQQVSLRAEALCKALQESRTPVSLGGAASEKATPQLIYIYQRMRESSFLIL